MKPIIKELLFMLTVVLFSHCEKEPSSINIPDDNFLNALIELGVDTNGDGKISKTEAEVITYLEVSHRSITDMKGIEAFVNLDTLFCYGNQLTTLDVSNNTALRDLYCMSNQLTTLDVSNTALVTLLCFENQLTTLDVSNSTALDLLWCQDNQLTTLDVSNNTALEWLYCQGNHLTTLDVSNNTALNRLYCYENQLTTLDVSNNTALERLICGDNQLTTLDVSNNTALFELYLMNMPSLYKVCVWTMPFYLAVNVNTNGSPNVYFTLDCD